MILRCKRDRQTDTERQMMMMGGGWIVIEIIPLPLVPSLLYLLLVGLDYVQYNSYEKRFDIKVKSKSYF